MSGCHAPNKNDYNERIYSLEKNDTDIELRLLKIESVISSLENKVDSLNKAYHHDSDVARDIIFEGARANEKIRQIESDCDQHCGAISVLERKVEALESCKLTQELDPQVWKHLTERIDKLEQSILETRILFINQLGNDKKPHKCPVCEGSCMRPNPLNSIENAKMPVNLDCIVCEGKGIVWG